MAFLLTLTGVAKDWFTGLPPKLVNSFKELRHQFLSQFLATRQGKEESLKDFMLHFNKEKLEVYSLNEKYITQCIDEGCEGRWAADG
jgi:hypothetical protein